MSTTSTQRLYGPRFLRVDLPLGRAQPRPLRVIVSLIIAVILSIAACWALAAAAIVLMPSTAGYEHFRFTDYARLTIIGVVIAGVAWPIVTLLSTHAHRMYLLADIIVVLVSFAPDLWILRGGQPIPAVIVLMLMHVALGVITYPVMVYGAPQRR
ncbi:MAG: DUF6069 family protein [Actinomycetota bacterium]